MSLSTRKTRSPEAAPADNREECYSCYRAKNNCLCGSVRSFPTRTRFVILMHRKEAQKQKTGTARLAKLCLENAELLIGTDFTSDEKVNSLLRDPAYAPFVLYPGPKAVNFKTLGKEAPPEGKPLLVFVLDGTWACAKRLLNRSQNLRALPRLSFSRGYVSQFAIKKQPREHCVSTIEAVYYLCREAEEAGYENLKGREEALMSIFEKLVDTQVYYQSGKGRTGREHWGKVNT